jgi:hypothetical protein
MSYYKAEEPSAFRLMLKARPSIESDSNILELCNLVQQMEVLSYLFENCV